MSMVRVYRNMDNIDPPRARLERPTPPATTLAYRVRKMGRVCNEPYHSTRGTYHGDAMLTVFLGGRGVYLHGRKRQTVQRGMVGLVLPQADPGLLMAEAAQPYDHLYCRFAGREALAIARRIQTEQQERAFFVTPRWPDVAERLLAELPKGQTGLTLSGETEDRLTTLEAALLGALAALQRPSRNPTPPLSAERLRAYLHEQVARPIDLDRAARHFGVSKPHLCRTARRLLGRTVQQEWEAGKMQWARVLLREPSLAIAEVAHRVGYADPFHFSRVFRRRHGLSPRQWRQSPEIDTNTPEHETADL